MDQRIKEISYLRAFAALSIILIHVTSGYVNTGPLGSSINQFPRYGSPLFVIISGFILCHIEVKRPSPSYLYFFKHRFLKVIIPYVVWTIVYTTYGILTAYHIPEGVGLGAYGKTYMLCIFTGTGYVHLYFILIMVQLYAIFPFLKKCIDTYKYATIVMVALLSFSVQALIYIHGLGIITLPSLGISYATLFPGWLISFSLGIFLKKDLKRLLAFWQKRKAFCALVWLCLMIIAMVEVRFSPVNISLRPIITLYGVATFFLFYLIFEKLKNIIPRKVDQLIQWTANNSFDVYLVHPLVLSWLVSTFQFKGYMGAITLYVSAVVFTGLFILVLSNVKSFIKERIAVSKSLTY